MFCNLRIFIFLIINKAINGLICYDSDKASQSYNGRDYRATECGEKKTYCWRKKYLPTGKGKLILKIIKKYVCFIILFVKDSEKVEQSCVVEPSAMEKAIMNPDDGCIYDPPYYANYIYKYFGYDSVSFDIFKIWIVLDSFFDVVHHF